MLHSFYTETKYLQKQSYLTKLSWKLGQHNSQIKPLETRLCKNKDCAKKFRVKPHNLKMFCSKSCSAHFNNIGRIHSEATKAKISKTISLSPHHYFPERKIRVLMICQKCGKAFKLPVYLSKIRKFCSVYCSISTTGRLTTSAKASKGKNGVRQDISKDINFYSTWEANMARVYSLVEIHWEYAPKVFDLGEHTYRPDFYLIDFDTFVEVKNYLNDYSVMRDQLFRKKFPNQKLDLLLKDDYLEIKKNYKGLVDTWEN